MAVLQVLSEMVSPEELLRLVALAKFVHMVEMLGPQIPLWWVGEFLATVSTHIMSAASRRGVKGGLDTSKSSTRPTVTSQVQGVLMSLGFILVFEPVRTVSTCVLLFRFVQA